MRRCAGDRSSCGRSCWPPCRTSRRRPRRRASALRRSGASSSRKSMTVNSTPAIGSMSSRSMPTTLPLPRGGADFLGRVLRPAARRRAEIDDLLARLEQMIALVDLDELVGGARAPALALGRGHIGIVELALQPQRWTTWCARAPVFTRTLSERPPSWPLDRAAALAGSLARAHGAISRSRSCARRRRRSSIARECLRASPRSAMRTRGAGNARRIASRMAQPASTRSARSWPMQPLAARSS